MKTVLIIWGGVLLLPLLLFPQTIPYQEGWPVEITEYKSSPIKIADINNDNIKELVLVGLPDNYNENVLYAFNNMGQIIGGFPIEGGIYFTGYPALSDLNDDGKMEIITTWYGLHIFDSEGNAILYYPYDGSIFQSKYEPFMVSIDDLDNDGIKEIVVTCYSGGAVFVFEPDGSVRDGWPVLGLGGMGSSASIGDIDQDGLKEIIVTSDKLYCFKSDGSNCPNFPFSPQPRKYGSLQKPVLVDLENDGFMEIIYINTNATPAMVIAIDHNANLLPLYPIELIGGAFSIIAGDIDSNNSFEALLSIYNGVGIDGYDILSAQQLQSFPLTDPENQFYLFYPKITDLSDDFGKEIIGSGATPALVSDGRLFAFNLNGEIISGFPSEILYHRVPLGCSVDDLDDDGDVEICCGSENDEFSTIRHSNVFCWDSPHPWNRDLADWMMDGFDLQNTGRWRKLYHIDKINSHLEFEGCTTNPCFLPPDGSVYAVTITAKRKFAEEYPAGQDVRLARSLGCGEYEGPVYDNGDGTYTRFFRAPTAECITKIEGWVNEFKLQENLQITFSNCEGNLGDINLNGDISSMDASEVLTEVVNPHFDLHQFCRGDVNKNIKITAMDASYILQCTVGLCTNLPPSFLLSCQSHGNCP